MVDIKQFLTIELNPVIISFVGSIYIYICEDIMLVLVSFELLFVLQNASKL